MAGRKLARNEARRRLGSGSDGGYKVRARRRGGRCVVTVTRRRRSYGQTLVVANAKTWARARAQVRSGFVREV